MDAGPLPKTELTLHPVRRRPRLGRVACLGLLPLLAVPVLFAGHAPSAGGDVAGATSVSAIGGHASHTTVRHQVGVARGAVAVTTTAAPTTSTTSTTAPARTTTTVATSTTTTAAPRRVRTPVPQAAPTTTRPPATTTTTAPRRVAAPVTTTTAPTPAPAPSHSQTGQGTWYRWKAGNCANNELPMGTVLTVTNLATGAHTTCTVGDRGAFRSPTIVDMDATVFAKIAPLGAGRISVRISW